MFKQVIASLALGLTLLGVTATADAAYIETWGPLSLLRVHDVGTGYGPASDFIDVEVVIAFSTNPDKAYGFKLRNDTNRAVHEGMLDVLRDAFANGWTVVINAELPAGKNHGVLNRVWIRR